MQISTETKKTMNMRRNQSTGNRRRIPAPDSGAGVSRLILKARILLRKVGIVVSAVGNTTIKNNLEGQRNI